MKVSDYNLYNSYWNTMTITNKSQKENTKQSSFSYKKSSGKKQGSGIVIKKNISASDYLLRLANAGSAPRVSGIVRSARAQMRFIKSSGASEEQIARAIRILKKVISKGNIKIGKLKGEKRLKIQKEMTENLKKAEELNKKLCTKKRSRKAKERIDAADMETATIESPARQPNYREDVTNVYQNFSEPESSIDVSISAASVACDAAASIDISI